MKKFFSLVLALVMALSLTTVAWADGNVAKIGETEYATLQAAVNAADGKTVVMLDNVTDTTALQIPEGFNVTLDMNGKTFTSMDGGQGNWMAILVKRGATLTLTGNGKIVASCYGVYVQPGATFNLVSSAIEVSGNGVYDMAVVVWNGTFNMSGGSLKGQEGVHTSNYWADNGETGIPTSTVSITAGSIEATGANPATIVTEGAYDIAISGGTFSDDVSTYVPADYKQNTDGSVVAKVYVAQVGSTKYESLAEAVAAVTTNDATTITLLKDCSGAGIFLAEGSKNITIDFDGHTFNCTGPAVGSEGTKTQAFHLEKGNTVKMMDGTITSTAGSGVKMLVQNYCNLTLDNMKLIGTNLDGTGTKYTLSNNCGDVVVEDTTITAAAGGVAFDTCKFSSYAVPTVTVKGTSVINGDVEASGGKLDIKNGTFNGDIAVVTGGKASDITISGGTFSSDVSEYLSSKLFQNGAGQVVATPTAIIPAGGATLAPSIDDLAVSQYAAWDAKVIAKKAENAKDSEFATYTIEMYAKIDNAPIWWASGVEDKGDDVDFTLNGEKTFVKVSAELAEFVVVDGKTITYFASADKYNEDGWDEVATKVVLPVLPDAEADLKCCTNYAWSKASSTFYEFNDTLYRAAKATDAKADILVFNVDGLVVEVVKAKMLDATRIDGDEKMAYPNLLKNLTKADYVYTAHNYVVEEKADSYGNLDVTKVYCDLCKNSFTFVESPVVSAAVTTFGAGNFFELRDDLYLAIDETTGATYSGSTGTTTTPSTEKVESAATFDAGIAMYVGMSVMAAAGSAVVLKKKED